MKVKHIIALFLLTYILVGFGAVFKIQHWPGASLLIVGGETLKLIAAGLAIWKIMTMEKFEEFLNS